MKEQNKNFEKEKGNIELREKIIKEWFPERQAQEEKVFPKRELSESEKEEREKLKERIGKLKLSSRAEVEILKEGEKIKRQNVQKQIDYLLYLAQQKGLSFALKTVKATNDAFLIDLFHDILAKQGLYKNFQM